MAKPLMIESSKSFALTFVVPLLFTSRTVHEKYLESCIWNSFVLCVSLEKDLGEGRIHLRVANDHDWHGKPRGRNKKRSGCYVR